MLLSSNLAVHFIDMPVSKTTLAALAALKTYVDSFAASITKVVASTDLGKLMTVANRKTKKAAKLGQTDFKKRGRAANKALTKLDNAAS